MEIVSFSNCPCQISLGQSETQQIFAQKQHLSFEILAVALQTVEMDSPFNNAILHFHFIPFPFLSTRGSFLF